jgi:23S rRNA (adenine2503-C2)-methyltransferase
MMRLDPFAADDAELAAVLGDEPAYRVRQLRGWLRRGVDDPAQMTDLPTGLRERLAECLAPPARVLRHSTADAGLTHKLLLEVGEPGSAEAVEAVLMLYPASGHRRARATVCVSTQAGCALGCPFCATGQAGFRRQLTVGEIVGQVTAMDRRLRDGTIAASTNAPPDAGQRIPDHVTHVVFMGMGEPLANVEATTAAVRWLHDGEVGLGLSARSITVSTVGLLPGIAKLTELGLPITLAVSLHAPTDALRDDLVPVNRRYGLDALLAACRDHQRSTGRRMTWEYILIDGVNAQPDHAEQLARLLTRRDAPRVAHVNLIPMNPTPAVPWHAPPADQQRAFAAVLTDAGLPATIRDNRGGDIDAACGQLYADYAVGSGRVLPAAAEAWSRLPVEADGAASGTRTGGGAV